MHLKLNDAEQSLFAGISRKDAALAVLRNAIVDGRSAPGTRLDQNEIAASLSVSRMPVREALKQLEVEGLVVMYPYRGVEVARLDPAAIREMFGIRVALERLAVAKACESLRASHFGAMEETLQTMDGQLGHPTEDDPWMRLNGAFHAVINQASEWPRLVETIDQFRGNVERYVRTYLSYRGREQSQREHWDLFEALRKRDADAAQAVIEKHLVNTADALVEAIETGDAAVGGRDAGPAPVLAR